MFLKDTAAHNTWCFYKEQTCDCVLAYAVELTGRERGKIKGNLYELDYARQYERVKDNALAADTVKLIYEHGTREIPAGSLNTLKQYPTTRTRYNSFYGKKSKNGIN